MPKRPTFYYGNTDNEIRAGGIIFFRKNNETIEFLLINNNGVYEDFGGKTDNNDYNFYDTIVREVYEESNGIFSKQDIHNRLLKSKPIYNKTCKYIVFFIELTPEEQKMSVSDFGNKELYNNFDRTVEYIDLQSFIKKKIQINIRLLYHSIKRYIKNNFIKNNNNKKINQIITNNC
jgi:hypothetical protein